jgi:hypothetical protein
MSAARYPFQMVGGVPVVTAHGSMAALAGRSALVWEHGAVADSRSCEQ